MTMETIHWISAAIVVAIASAIVAGEARRIWKRRTAALQADVLIGCALERVGITPADVALAGHDSDLRRATGRCRDCRLAPDCRSRLARLVPRPLPKACPNAGLFDQVRQHRAVLEENRTGTALDEFNGLAQALTLATTVLPPAREQRARD
jgi:hypothetical protein